VKPVVVTVMEALACCAKLSSNVTLHVPAPTPVTVYVAVGPEAFDVAIVATLEHVSFSENVPA